MPYIGQEVRKRLVDEGLNDVGAAIDSAGELNYCISRLCGYFLFGGQTDPHYEKFNAAIGVLESAKLEIYRQLVAEYEDGKREENGDVYDLNYDLY